MELGGEIAFAALKDDGSVVAWGDPGAGGVLNHGSSGYLGSDVVKVVPGWAGFAALKQDGQVITWGDIYEGDSSSVASELAPVDRVLDTSL